MGRHSAVKRHLFNCSCLSLRPVRFIRGRFGSMAKAPQIGDSIDRPKSVGYYVADLVERGFSIKNGEVLVPAEPGLGANLNEEVARGFRVD